jgi:hypothetical protein
MTAECRALEMPVVASVKPEARLHPSEQRLLKQPGYA